MTYCSVCGSQLELKTIEGAERQVCPSCRKVFYENPLPTAGAFIIQDTGEVQNPEPLLLLVRRANDPFKGEWDIPGGFLEKHESPVDALKRELKEELGVDAKIGDLVGIFMGIYSDHDVSTLNIYYHATIVSGTPVAASDVSEIGWFPLDSLPPIAFPQNQEAIAELKRKLQQ